MKPLVFALALLLAGCASAPEPQQPAPFRQWDAWCLLVPHDPACVI